MATPAPTKIATPATLAASATPSAAPAAGAGAVSTPIPSSTVMLQAAKIAIEQDRAIMLDYYVQTANGTAFLGEDSENKDNRILVKTKEEFTSLIKKVYKVGEEDLIVLTENSLYIVSNKIQKRKVNLAALHEAYDASL
jgi:hypothetical protein